MRNNPRKFLHSLAEKATFALSVVRVAGLLSTTFFAAVLPAVGQVKYVKTYANFVRNTTQQKDVTPQGMQTTSDGGYVFLASTACTTNACILAQGNRNPVINWLVKTDSSGNPQWQKELGCLSALTGYSIASSVQQTSDGGYIVGGGETCYEASGIQEAIVEKVDSRGNLVWSKNYAIGRNGDGIAAIKQTADGGFVAAGGVFAAGEAPSGGLILKLDASGNVQWQSVVGPMGATTVVFNALQQTSDGGYVATGNYYTSSSQCQPFECEGGLVVKLDASGNVEWQQGLTAAGSNSLFIDSLIATADGGYVAAGAWFGTNQKGGLLVKLDSNGNILWQNAYSGGSYFGAELGVVIYSVHQTSDGGYFLAGDGEDKLQEGGRLVPWLGKVDSNGNLLWEHFYYQVYRPTGRALSEYFAGGDVAQDGGFVAAGWTEDYAVGLGLLFVVKTDSSGLCGSCGDVHPDEGLTVVNPGLTISPLSLPVSTTATQGTGSLSKTRSTAIKTKKDCFTSGATGAHIHSGQRDQRGAIDFYGKEVLPRLRQPQSRKAA